MSRPLSERRIRAIVERAVALVEDGHSEGSDLLELVDEIDRLSGREPRGQALAQARGWTARGRYKPRVPPKVYEKVR